MKKLSGFNVLVYDTPSLQTERLKASLVREGAVVRVTGSILAAMEQLDTGRIDTAFVAYRSDRMTCALCARLDLLGIPKIFTGSSPKADASRIAA